MGITISHTNFAPISLIFTLGTFIKVFWSNLGTFAAAPQEIKDYLSSLKQGLIEERRHLRKSRRRLRSIQRDKSHGPGARGGSDEEYARGNSSNGVQRKSRGEGGRARSGKRGPMHFDRDIQSMRSTGEAEALRVMRVTVKDLIKSFRELEQPFLKPEFQQQDSMHWSTRPLSPSPHNSEKPDQNTNSDDDSPHVSHMRSTNRMGNEYRNCDFKQRWLWVRKKATVLDLSTVLSRVEVRRTAHEVGEVLSMVCNIGRDLDDMQQGMQALEGRLSRVVGIRRVS
jgi:hypothetical protein